jgi:cytochrome P450
MQAKPSPPSLNLFDSEFAANPQPVFQELRRHCPVGRPAPEAGLVVSRYEDVLYALKHPEIFSSHWGAAPIGNKRPLIPLQLDPPLQTRYRKILDPLFSRRKMLELQSDVRTLVNQLIDGFIDRGACEFDRDFAIPLPSTVFLRLMGLPIEDLDRFLEMKDGIIRPQQRDPARAAEIREESGERIYAYFEGFLDERTREPREDLISQLLQAELEGERLSREEILDISFLFLLGGLDTVTATLGCSVAYLAQHPDRRRQVVERPELMESAVEELLRWETPVVQVPRMVAQDTTLAGVELRAGDVVTLVLGSADTDDAEFPDAQCVRLERERNRHLAFGGGPHRCLGSHLARMELRTALAEWHQRIPDYAIQPGETPRYTPGIREVVYLPLVWGRGA